MLTNFNEESVIFLNIMQLELSKFNKIKIKNFISKLETSVLFSGFKFNKI